MVLAFRSIQRGFRTLIFPPRCIGCDLEREYLCQRCITLWSSVPVVSASLPIPIYSILRYSNLTSTVILAAKEDRNRSARRLIAGAFASSLEMISRQSQEPLTLVPIPSSKAAVRIRGEAFLLPIIAETLELLDDRCDHLPIDVNELLFQRRKVREQTGLSFSERQTNVAHALAVSESALRKSPPKSILLIDDVITTGSTLMSGYQALRERNLTVIAGVTACASAQQMPIR